MADLSTRELEQFVAVAEELHFGRAATRLTISQPALSKTIQRIEGRLGDRLLLRASSGISLTPAGEALLHHGKPALAAVSAAFESAHQAADCHSRMRLVVKPGAETAALARVLDDYARQPGSAAVEVLFGGDLDRGAFVRDGRADVALLYVPFDDLEGLGHEVLLTEDRVAVLPANHPLAGHVSLLRADLQGETFPRWSGMDDHQQQNLEDSEGEGRQLGPTVSGLTEVAQMVALGRVVAVLPRSLAEPLGHGLAHVPVRDAPASQLVAAWSTLNHSPAIRSFVRAAVRAYGAQPDERAA